MFGDDPPRCSDCGNARHIYSWECPMNLHGEADPFKTSCAVCETPIPSGADRDSDKFGNLYCDAECRADGLATLLDRVQRDDRPDATDSEASA